MAMISFHHAPSTRLAKSPPVTRKYAAERANAEEEAFTKGMAEKSKEFVEKGAEVYAPA